MHMCSGCPVAILAQGHLSALPLVFPTLPIPYSRDFLLGGIRAWGTGVAKSLRGSGVIKLGLIRARFDYLRGAAAHDAREPVTRTLENRVTLPRRTGSSGRVTRRPPTAKWPALIAWRLALMAGLHAQAYSKRAVMMRVECML